MLKWKALRKVLIPAAGLFLSSQVYATSLTQAVQETVTSNPQVLVTTNTRRANEYAVRNAQADYLPSVDLTAGYGRESSKNATVAAQTGSNGYRTLTRKESGVYLNQLIFDGFGTPSEIARRRSELCASSYDVYATSQDIGLDAIAAYLDVLKNQELVGLARTNVATHLSMYDMIKRRGRNGLGHRADNDEARGRLALARANLQARQSSLRDAKIAYTRIVGTAPTNLHLSRIGFSMVPHSREQALSVALANHPRLKQAHWDVEEAEAQHRLSKSLFWPRLDFEAGGNWDVNVEGSKGTNNGYYAMLRADYNVLRGGGDLARKRETAYIIQRAREIMNRTRREVSETTGFSWNALVTTRNRMEQLKRHRQSSRDSLSAFRKQFKLGKRTLLDVLDSENEYFEASNSLVDEKYMQILAHYRLLNATGQLLQAVQVSLPPEAYCDEDESFMQPAVVHEETSPMSDKAQAAASYASKAMPEKAAIASATPATATAANTTSSTAGSAKNFAAKADRFGFAKNREVATVGDKAAANPTASKAKPLANAQAAEANKAPAIQTSTYAAKPAAIPRDFTENTALARDAQVQSLPEGTTIITPEGTRVVTSEGEKSIEEFEKAADSFARQHTQGTSAYQIPPRAKTSSKLKTGNTRGNGRWMARSERGHRATSAQATQTAATTAARGKTGYSIQTGTFSVSGNAQAMVSKLRAKGFVAYTREGTHHGKRFVRVLVEPPFSNSYGAAKSVLASVEQAVNTHCLIVKEKKTDSNA